MNLVEVPEFYELDHKGYKLKFKPGNARLFMKLQSKGIKIEDLEKHVNNGNLEVIFDAGWFLATEDTKSIYDNSFDLFLDDFNLIQMPILSQTIIAAIYCSDLNKLKEANESTIDQIDEVYSSEKKIEDQEEETQESQENNQDS